MSKRGNENALMWREEYYNAKRSRQSLPVDMSNQGCTPAKPTSSGGFSFGAAAAAAEASKSLGDRAADPPVGLAIGSTPAAKTEVNTATPAAAPGPVVCGGAKATTTSTDSKPVEQLQKHAKALETAFYNECANLSFSTTFLSPLLDETRLVSWKSNIGSRRTRTQPSQCSQDFGNRGADKEVEIRN